MLRDDDVRGRVRSRPARPLLRRWRWRVGVGGDERGITRERTRNRNDARGARRRRRAGPAIFARSRHHTPPPTADADCSRITTAAQKTDAVTGIFDLPRILPSPPPPRRENFTDYNLPSERISPAVSCPR